MSDDYLIRATAAHDFVRAFAVTDRGVTEEARKRHRTSPTASAALGRTMAAALMMGADLKNDDDLVTVQFEGDGPIGVITVTANSRGGVKGFVGNPSVSLPPREDGHFDVGGAVGHGNLRVIRDTGLKEPYAGSVDIQTGEIAQDITYYYAVSEQVPSAVALGVLTDRTRDYEIMASGGYMVQLMPDCPDDIISLLENNVSGAPSVTDMLRSGKTPEDMLALVLDGMDMEIHTRKDVAFQCDCSRERVEKAIIAMGKKEIQTLIEEGEPVTLTCQFCRTEYTFSIDALKEIWQKTAG
ncbi:MAG: Hsp33 family molecular chaperone HslO [Lachnospiraceae bacterium]|nr:Hsp33 family molecular chaperone HslO [Lachnospiraceae bacterium]